MDILFEPNLLLQVLLHSENTNMESPFLEPQ